MGLFRAKQTNWNHCMINIVFKKPNWREADQLAIEKVQQRSWFRGNWEQIQWGAEWRAWQLKNKHFWFCGRLKYSTVLCIDWPVKNLYLTHQSIEGIKQFHLSTHWCIKFWNNSDSTHPSIFHNIIYIVFCEDMSFIVVCTLKKWSTTCNQEMQGWKENFFTSP